jgi:protein DGCR14
MFPATSVDEEGLQTVQEVKEANSKAGPKHVVHSNTRFPPQLYLDDPGPVPASPSLNTDIITRRDARRATGAATPTITGSESHNGAETPRVNGYAFVDEDEPNNNPIQQPATTTPSYRDLLAGQTGDGTPNPFRISDVKKRESVHLRMLEKTARRNREKERETMRTPITGSGGVDPGRRQAAGNMTPAARKLMDKLGGRTPVAGEGAGKGEHSGRGISIDWTPGRTPRRSRIGK